MNLLTLRAMVALTALLFCNAEQTLAGTRHRPQEERIAGHPKPYREEQVFFPNPRASGVRLAGTLLVPRGAGPFTGVVYIAGSGPNTRDEVLAHHKLGLVVADALTRSGFAVLRYDKRGISKSTGNFDDATFMEFADDAVAAVAYLHTRPEISKVGLVGHSEGGTTAAWLAAKDPSLAFIVMMAGYSISGKQLVAEQERRIAIVNGEKEEEAAIAYRLNLRLYQEIAESRDQMEARSRVDSLLASASPRPPKAQAEEAILFTELPAMRFVLGFDPLRYLGEVRVPVLALYGTKDLVVPADLNAPVLKGALTESKDVTIREMAGLNHLFQHASTGSPREFEKIEETISPEVLDIISQWLAEHRT